MTEMTATEGNFVVLQLIDDALLTDQVLRECFDTVDEMTDLESKMLIGFVHYVFARPIGMSRCSQTDAEHILDALLDALVRSGRDLDYTEVKTTIPMTHRLLSAGDPATVHIRTSTAFFLQAMEKDGHMLTDDDSKLRLLLNFVESLQVEVQFFLNYVLEQYRLDWTPRSGELTAAKRRQAEEIADLRKMVREEAERITGA